MRAVAQLVKQPRVLNGNRRLRGEGVDHVDLVLGKSAWRCPEQVDDAKYVVVPHKGDAERGAQPRQFLRLRPRIVRILKNVPDVYSAALQDGLAKDRTPIR